jgi:hypothetical protein
MRLINLFQTLNHKHEPTTNTQSFVSVRIVQLRGAEIRLQQVTEEGEVCHPITAIYYWGIEFKDGLKLIITNVFYYDSDNGYIDLPKFEPIFWHFYISPYSETEDNAETVKDKLEDIFLIKL